MEIISVYSENHTKYIITLCERNVELLNVRLTIVSRDSSVGIATRLRTERPSSRGSILGRDERCFSSQ
jgi:hypothetical protein